MSFEIGQTYTRSEVFRRLIGEEVSTKGHRSVGVVREGQYVLAFANVGVAGRTGHNFPNEFDEAREVMIWFGQPGAHSGWRDMADVISGRSPLLMFTRSEDRQPFTFRGEADVLDFTDGVTVRARDKEVKTIRFKLGFSKAADVLDAFEPSSDPHEPSASGQGTGLSTEEKKAVELHAMRMAQAHLEAQGFTVIDVSNDRRSYDLHASQAGEELAVEVKGTTGDGEAVIMTGNEVRVLRVRHPHTSLIVVSRIHLDRSEDSAVASGGALQEFRSVDLADRYLTATQYRVALPSRGD